MIDIIKILFFGILISIVEVNLFKPITINLLNHRVPDLLLIYLIYITAKYGRSKGIVVAFVFGLIQDISTQVNLLGIFSFSKSIFVYVYGIVIYYDKVWSTITKNVYLFICMVVHFSIYYINHFFNGEMILLSFISIVFIQGVINYIIYIFIFKYALRNEVYYQ